MLIQGRRIRSISKRLGFLTEGQSFIIGIRNPIERQSTLAAMGFSFPLAFGDTVLPAPLFGPISRFNAEGKYIPLRNQPKEIAYREIVWRWKQWVGRGETEEKEENKFVGYERFPRRFMPAPAIELTIRARTDGSSVLVTESIVFTEDNHDEIRNRVNLLLEIFRECEIFHENLEEIIHVPVRRLQWRVLPEGQREWSNLTQTLEPIINSQRHNHEILWNRFHTIVAYEPSFVAVGHGGFYGYVVFGFRDRGVYVLESIFSGNATYVFGENWEAISQLSKIEVLRENLCLHRFIHVDGWYEAIYQLLGLRRSA